MVATEVLFGITDRERHRAVVRALVAGTELLAPDPSDWIAAASAIAALGGDTVTKVRSFWNDALLAAQCARLGLTVVTRNGAGFRRLGRRLAVRTVAPFP